MLIRLKQFKKAFEVAATNLEFTVSEHLADFAIRLLKSEETPQKSSSNSGRNKRKPQLPEGLIYTELYAALVATGNERAASHALDKYAKNIDMLLVAEKHIDDDHIVDDAMFAAFTKVFIDLEEQQKRSQVKLKLANQTVVNLYTGEYYRAMSASVIVNEETRCAKCNANISNYPFTFNAKT